MQECYVLFHNVSDIRDFVSLATKQNYEIRVEQGNLQSSATSIMSVFSMGFNRPVRVLVPSDQADTAAFFQALEAFFTLAGAFMNSMPFRFIGSYQIETEG